jgi:hypothetical protein
MAKAGIYGDAGASGQALNNREPISVGRDWSINAGSDRDIAQPSDTTYVSAKHVGDPTIAGTGTGAARSQGQIGARLRTMAEMMQAWPRPWQSPRQIEPNNVTDSPSGRPNNGERGGMDYGFAPSNGLAVSARAVQDHGGTGPPRRVARLIKSDIREWDGLSQHGMTQRAYQFFMRHESFWFKQQYQTRKAKSISGSLFSQGPTASRVRIPAVFVPRTIS